MSVGLVAVTVETRHTPPLTFSEADIIGDPLGDAGSSGGASGAGSPSSWLGGLVARFLRPKLTVATPWGSRVVAPYGDPGATSWPASAFIAAGLVVLGAAGLAVLVFQLGERRGRRAAR